MKKYIPNILTTYRALASFTIPFLFVNNYYKLLVIILFTALLSDAFDGYLARRWNVTSTYGKVLDVIGDKALAILTISTILVLINKFFIILLVFELIITIINVTKFIKLGYLKEKNFNGRNSSIYGKIKTIFLFITVFIGYMSTKINFFNYLTIPFLIITTILEIITAIDYIKN